MVDAAYYGSACPCCGKRAVRAVSVGVSFDEKMLEGFLREIYDEEVVPSEGGISEQLYEATRDIFERATAQGMAQSRNKRIVEEEDFLKHYTHSIEVFSAFRTHRYGEMMASMLHDEEGRLRPFEEWRKATESLQSHFNRSWLETEYSTAILRAQQAADWKGFERDKDIAPNLTWMPTSSADPREEHAVFWRDALTLPVDDPFWDEHRPGDLWNCKCWLKQTDAQATPQREIPKGKGVPKPARGLEQNPGKTAEMFSPKQPHYPNPKTCIWLKLAKGKGTEAKAGRFWNSAKCIGNCNQCPLLAKWRFKQNKKTYSKQIKQWAEENLEPVRIDKHNTAKRLTVPVDGYEVVVNKGFLKETFDKYVQNESLGLVMDIAKDVKTWLPSALHVATEQGRHHDYEFEIFTTTYKGHKVKAEVRSTEGLILHVIKVDDADNYRY